MRVQDEVTPTAESQQTVLSEDLVSEALQIEEVLNLAYEIRRARGGMFGYDLEDWLEAERELAERHRKGPLPMKWAAQAESLPWGEERISARCFRTSQ